VTISSLFTSLYDSEWSLQAELLRVSQAPRRKNFIISAIIAGIKRRGSIAIHSLKPKERVSKIGRRKGRYTTARRREKEAITANCMYLFERTPIEKMECRSEREV